NKLVCESPGSCRLARELLTLKCVSILFFAGDLVHRCEVFCRFTHDEFGERAIESVAIHSVNEMMIAHTQAPSSLFDEVWHIAHRFHATCSNDFRISQQDFLVTQNDGF